MQLCLDWRGRRKWFVAVQELHTHIQSAEVHSIIFKNGGTMFNAPAVRAASSALVTDMHIRHYRGTQVNHLCQRVLSPSVLSKSSPQDNPHMLTNATNDESVRIYVMFASTCDRFQLFVNAKMVVTSDDAPEDRLYGAHINVSAGDVFAVSMNGCKGPRGFIGCFGALVCTGPGGHAEITRHT